MSNEDTIQCVVVDDEKLARNLLEDLIRSEPGLELRGIFRSTTEVRGFLSRTSVDVLFLDIQMPGETGIDFLKTFDNGPKVVLTTAYSDYAIEGFDLNVFDYLLKPITEDRFYKCISRIKQTLLTEDKANAYSLIAHRHSQPYLQLKSGAYEYKITYDEILLFKASGEYIEYHTRKKKYLVLGSLKKLADKLSEDLFIQVHRSYIVPFPEIYAREKYMLLLKNGFAVPIGKTFRKKVLEKLRF